MRKVRTADHAREGTGPDVSMRHGAVCRLQVAAAKRALADTHAADGKHAGLDELRADACAVLSVLHFTQQATSRYMMMRRPHAGGAALFHD